MAGFWGAIIGGITAIGSAIASAVTAMAPAVAGVISTVGGFLSKGLATVGKVLTTCAEKLAAFCGKIAPVLEKLAPIISSVATVIDGVSKVVGITDKDDNALEMGERAYMSDKSIEDFESSDEYIKHLKSIEIDKEKLNNLTPEEKYARMFIGSAIEINAIDNKLDITSGEELWGALGHATVNGLEMKSEQVVEFINALKANGYENLQSVVDYLKGDAKVDIVKTGADVKEALAKVGIEDVTGTVNILKEAVRPVNIDKA